MKILYDYQTFSMQRFGGISRYHRILWDQINATPGESADISVRYAQNEFLPESIAKTVSPVFHKYEGRGRGKLIHIADLWNKRNVKKDFTRWKPDVFHPTYYNPYFRSFLGTTPYVITVHDMIHELFSSDIADPQTALLKRESILGAQKVIAISESTKRDLLSLLPVDESKIEVIHHGPTFVGDEPGSSISGLPEKYVLYVGARGAYKNFASMAVALAPYLQERGEVALVCAGGGAFTSSERGLFEGLGITRYVRWFSATDGNLATLYRNAEVFVLPSKYEGFGLPVLEAMAFGCPCLLSDSSSLPEVGGDAAAYFDPNSEESIRTATATVLEDGKMRESLSEKGRRRVLDFSWELSVQKHLDLYRRL